jgi:hypothetical protein
MSSNLFTTDLSECQYHSPVKPHRLSHLQALEIMTKDAETPDALPIFYNSDDNQFYEL